MERNIEFFQSNTFFGFNYSREQNWRMDEPKKTLQEIWCWRNQSKGVGLNKCHGNECDLEVAQYAMQHSAIAIITNGTDFWILMAVEYISLRKMLLSHVQIT